MILVTGGTGLVGSHLLYSLVESGEKVRAIHRKNSDLERVKHIFSYFGKEAESLYDKIEWTEACLTDIPSLTKAFEGITKVYHAAAYVSFNPKHYHKLEKVNVEGTANIVNLCLSHPVEKLCHFSSVATLGKNPAGKEIDEECHWNPDEESSVYSITKYGAEMEVWRGMQEGLDAVILNPGIILGSGFWYSGTGAFFSSAEKNNAYYTLGENGFTDVADVVKIAVALMNSPLKNERFVVVSENRSFKDLFTSIAFSLGKKLPHRELKPWMLALAWRLDKIRNLLTGSRQKLFRSIAKSAVAKRHYSNKKITETLHYTFLPLEETISRIASDLKKDWHG